MGSTPISTVLAAGFEKMRKDVAISALRRTALLTHLMSAKSLVGEDGAPLLTSALVTGSNSNIQSYEYYDTLTVNQTNELSKLSYNTARVAGSVIISRQEMDENASNVQLVKIMETKLKVLKRDLMLKFSQYVYGAGAGKDPNGLQNLIPDNPTVGSLAGLSRADNIVWRTSSYDFTSSPVDETTIEAVIEEIIYDLMINKDEKPTIIVMGRTFWGYYRAAVRNKTIINLGESGSGKNLVNSGFTGYTYMDIPIVYDESCPATRAYFINSDYLKMHYFKNANFKQVELTAPMTVDGEGIRVIWQGQLCLWEAFRRHAVMFQ